MYKIVRSREKSSNKWRDKTNKLTEKKTMFVFLLTVRVVLAGDGHKK